MVALNHSDLVLQSSLPGNGTPLIKLVKAWKASLDQKRDLITQLAEVQSEIEDCEGNISAMLGKKKTEMYAANYYYHEHFVDKSTAIRQFKDEVSRISFKPFNWTYSPEKKGTLPVSLITSVHDQNVLKFVGGGVKCYVTMYLGTIVAQVLVQCNVRTEFCCTMMSFCAAL